jgi:phosphoenolpyruvate carboxykinase (ATP)
MSSQNTIESLYGLDQHGIHNLNAIYWNLPTPRLYEEVIRRREGRVSHIGPLVIRTGHHTGRSPQDKFIVQEPTSFKKIWWGEANRSMSPQHFATLRLRLLAYLQGKDVYVQDCFAGAAPAYRIPIRIITETAWHNLFARNLFIQAELEELANHIPDFTLLHVPNFHAIPQIDGTRSEVFVVIHFGERLILIGGTHYAGEIKKSIFTALNYVLPQQKVLSMHCSASMNSEGDVAIFFGLSGTGKTTLSTDPSRILIGDDEHGWSEEGIFNLEGGCYAKIIRISPEAEPEIFETTRKFATILENVGFDSQSCRIDLNDDTLTENTRAGYPMSHIPSATRKGMGGHPKDIVMLTADAFGVLPPIAKLTPEQAVYHFLSGYTAKVAGTEKGVTEPEATFSTCFGAPFMALSPLVYAELFKDKISRHDVKLWLVNTGWTGGPYGVGSRFKIQDTRAMIHAALNGKLDDIPTREDPTFGLFVPVSCPGVADSLLDPRKSWPNPAAYDAQALKLASLFADNFKKYEHDVPPAVRSAGPTVS